MKKVFRSALVCVMALAMIVVSAACNNSSSNGKFNSIADFVNSAEMQEQIKSLKATFKAQGMDVDMTGEGNKLIYTYTFAKGTDLTGAAETLKAGLKKEASTFKQVASTIKQGVNVKDPVVVVTYKDSDGKTIYSEEFTAD